MLQVQGASFSRDAHGRLCIALDDAAFTRADVVFIDPSSREISALLDGMQVGLGRVTADMAKAFMEQGCVFLTAPHPQGHDLTLIAPVLTIH
ncbi:MAG: hypothetical protein EBQ96_04085 [Proteobacteria bacterium]|nr:hypothetical protein [Pseudomonadota bacterium]